MFALFRVILLHSGLPWLWRSASCRQVYPSALTWYMYRSHLCFMHPPFHPGSASDLPHDKLTNSDNYKSKPISLYTQGEFGTCIAHTFVSCFHNTIHAALIGMSRRQFTIMSQNLTKMLNFTPIFGIAVRFVFR